MGTWRTLPYGLSRLALRLPIALARVHQIQSFQDEARQLLDQLLLVRKEVVGATRQDEVPLIGHRQSLEELARGLWWDHLVCVATNQECAAGYQGAKGIVPLHLRHIQRAVESAYTCYVHNRVLQALHVLHTCSVHAEVLGHHFSSLQRHSTPQGVPYKQDLDLAGLGVGLRALHSFQESVVHHPACAPHSVGHPRSHVRPRATVTVHVCLGPSDQPPRDCREECRVVKVLARLPARADTAVHAWEEEGKGTGTPRVPLTKVADGLDPRALELQVEVRRERV
mmetsp:Transcript_10500/g.29182  ORF Transcript_10500/g.29182 Transcript_10500/m.29182 type:complete len:282 (+) Transcript_10500:93-938(+)